MLHVIKSFIIAFSMYSRIPMPKTEWKDEDMKYVFCFFPLVGVVIGALILGWNALCAKFSIVDVPRAALSMAIALIVSGGIHVDGFMDTADALSSYKEKEQKLEILKDPHIGAFAVIRLAVFGLIYLASLCVIHERNLNLYLSVSFVLARVMSALAAVFLKSAKKDGTLANFADRANRIAVRIVVIAEALLCVAVMIWIHPLYGAVLCALSGGCFLHYALLCRKQFGGITGDTEGYFVVKTEGVIAFAVAVISVIGRGI